MNGIKLMNKMRIVQIALLLLFVTAGSSFAENKHSKQDSTNHVCFGVGLHGGIYRGGLQARLWINDFIGFSAKGYGDWSLQGGGGLGELMIKAPLQSRFRPYLTIGGGFHYHQIDTTLDGQKFKTDLGMGTFRVALGGELRLGDKQNHGLSLEAGYFRGSADYKHTRTEIGENGVTADTSTYTVEPFTGKLYYTFYFCKPKDKDSDGDGLLDKDDACPQEPEDKDGFKDSDGCPEYDNDNDGLADTVDDCPNNPEDIDSFEDINGCPDPDNDKDLILDTLDECPNDAEDKDGFEDKNGCPDYDNDQDGIPDTTDDCPDSAEIFNEFMDSDGCPDVKPVTEEITRGAIVLDGVTFESSKADLKHESFEILNEVAKSLDEWIEIKIEIQGHTDAIGAADFNQNLSQKRAESVMNYLISQGVDALRLTAVGYGEDQPIADNATRDGRAENRRVEMHRVD